MGAESETEAETGREREGGWKVEGRTVHDVAYFSLLHFHRLRS